jgi:hypothetical protein
MDNQNYTDILITDIQLHILKPRKPKSWLYQVLKANRTKQKTRAYSTDIRNNNGMEMSLPPAKQIEVDRAEKEGKKIRFVFPEDGVLMYPGPDLIEYLEAKNKIKY